MDALVQAVDGQIVWLFGHAASKAWNVNAVEGNAVAEMVSIYPDVTGIESTLPEIVCKGRDLRRNSQDFTLRTGKAVGEDALISRLVRTKTKPAPEKALSASAAKLRLLKTLRCTLKLREKGLAIRARAGRRGG